MLESLLVGGSIRAASELLCCSTTTIRARLQNPDFRQRYENAKSEILTAAVDQMRGSLSTATNTLIQIMGDTETPPSVRVQASDALLRHCLRYIEVVDLTSRVMELERLSRGGLS